MTRRALLLKLLLLHIGELLDLLLEVVLELLAQALHLLLVLGHVALLQGLPDFARQLLSVLSVLREALHLQPRFLLRYRRLDVKVTLFFGLMHKP